MAKNDNTHTLYCTIYACRISEAKSNTCIEKKTAHFLQALTHVYVC